MLLGKAQHPVQNCTRKLQHCHNVQNVQLRALQPALNTDLG